MAYNIQARTQKLRPTTPGSTSSHLFFSRNDDDENEMAQVQSDETDNAGRVKNSANDFSPIGRMDTKANLAALAGSEDYVLTSPIDVPAASPQDEFDYLPDESDFPRSRYCDPSPLEKFFRNRRTSISFNPRVTLETGQRWRLDEPLRNLEIDTKPRGRSILEELSRRTASPTVIKAYSDAERIIDDSVIGEQVTGEEEEEGEGPNTAQSKIRSSGNSSRYPLLQSSTQSLPVERRPTDIEQGASLTSDSTVSSVQSEARTPVDNNIDYIASPMSSFSPFHRSISLEESNTWPVLRRQGSAPKAKSYSFNRKSSFRQSERRGSRRSTASSHSPAATFLMNFAREELAASPDDEGQEVGEYVLGRQIGFGAFSIVREAFTIEDQKRVARAVKIVRKQVANKEDLENEQFQADFEHEVGLWRCLAHHHILSLIAVHVTSFATFCFTNLNNGGTLFDLVKANRQGLSHDFARRYTYQLSSAIRYLHEDMRIVHRDIKLENCLIDFSKPNAAVEGGHLLLCDFGLAEFITNENPRDSPVLSDRGSEQLPTRNIESSDASTSAAVSLQYASPELILSPARFLSRVVDLWALGVVVYTLLVGDLPFQHVLPARVRKMILAGTWNVDALRRAKGATGVEEDVIELVQGCLQMQADDRWVIGQVLDSRWLNGCPEMMDEISESWKL